MKSFKFKFGPVVQEEMLFKEKVDAVLCKAPTFTNIL